MPTPRRSAQEMVQALERWGLERWPRFEAFYAPLREAAAREAVAARPVSKPKAAPRPPPRAPASPPTTRVDAAKLSRPKDP